MGTFLSLLILAAIIYVIFEVFQVFKFRKNKEIYKSHAKKMLIGILAMFLLLFLFSFTSEGKSDDTSDSKPKTEKKVTKKENDKETKDKSAKKENDKNKSDKKEEDKKEAKEVADTKKKNLAKNLEDYKNNLADVPNKTNGVISSASIDPDNGETIVVLSDDALQDNGQQMQEVAHSAWNAIHNMGDNYKLSENPDTHANLIEIRDQAGDTIATTTFTGNFKYKGMK